MPEVDKSDEEVETSKERPAPLKRRKSSTAYIQQAASNSTSEASSSKSTSSRKKGAIEAGPRQTAAQKRKAAKEKEQADNVNNEASDSNKDDDEEFVPALKKPRPRARRIVQKAAIVESGSDSEEVVQTVERNLGVEMLNPDEVAAEERLWA